MSGCTPNHKIPSSKCSDIGRAPLQLAFELDESP
jgi:hypothetical protein